MAIIRLDRRQILKATVASGALAIAAPFIISPSRGDQSLVFVGFGGSYQSGQSKALFEPFEKETGIKIIQREGIDLAKLKAQIQSGGGVDWDLAGIVDRDRYAAVRDGLLMPLDYSVINAQDIPKKLVTKDAVGAIITGWALCYNTDKFTSATPQNWADFWNVSKFPGPRGMWNGAPQQLEFALLADGVPKDQLYPLDVKRAFKSLDRIKPNVKVWWPNVTQAGVLFKSGEIVASPWTRGADFARAGEHVGFTYNEACMSYEAWVVPKGAKNAINAMKFINFALDPKRQADLTKYTSFGPTNPKAMQYVDPKIAPLLAAAPENLEKGFFLDGEWWGKNLDKVSEQWKEWQLS
jgi:putative spermidine/putrescine transport system substrate-binding protein